MPTTHRLRKPVLFPAGHEHILLAEDDDQIRAMMKTALERKGYTVTSAVNGIEAAAILASTPPDRIHLLIADLLMPRDLNGLELSEHLRERYPTVRTLYISGYSAEQRPADLTLPPGAPFLAKPFSIQALLTTVRRCLDAPPPAP